MFYHYFSFKEKKMNRRINIESLNLGKRLFGHVHIVVLYCLSRFLHILDDCSLLFVKLSLFSSY